MDIRLAADRIGPGEPVRTWAPGQNWIMTSIPNPDSGPDPVPPNPSSPEVPPPDPAVS
ncbi:MAG: hypothetical protein JWN61_731 [Pseudonocardiales bacterium]|nr:hypothetical protein [Jatrophihabitantaceae bacterium]MCW2602596.1 hypothetical protein [Pseudonocardiales bacterium]